MRAIDAQKRISIPTVQAARQDAFNQVIISRSLVFKRRQEKKRDARRQLRFPLRDSEKKDTVAKSVLTRRGAVASTREGKDRRARNAVKTSIRSFSDKTKPGFSMNVSEVESTLKARRIAFRKGLVVAATICCAVGAVAGCATPFFFTDNKALLYLPGAGRRSDEIPGVIRPWERAKLIEEKGKKGAKASPDEKDVLLAQLVDEYEKTGSPYIKRSALDAIASISTNYSNPVAERLFKLALEDEDLALNLTAARALGDYCAEGEVAKSAARERRYAAELLASRFRSLPYSFEPGSEEENARRKDVRIAILRALGRFNKEDSEAVMETLEYGLNGERLDDGALMTQACRSLRLITGKNYGLDGEAWLQYLEYERGERDEPPKEISKLSMLPQLTNETGVFK